MWWILCVLPLTLIGILSYKHEFFAATRLSYLHSQRIVHRDVKTENMLLDKARTVKIADFGVARVEAQNPNEMTGETGTLGYMAPEVYIYCALPVVI